jgi:hypothetical protein
MKSLRHGSMPVSRMLPQSRAPDVVVGFVSSASGPDHLDRGVRPLHHLRGTQEPSILPPWPRECAAVCPLLWGTARLCCVRTVRSWRATSSCRLPGCSSNQSLQCDDAVSSPCRGKEAIQPTPGRGKDHLRERHRYLTTWSPLDAPDASVDSTKIHTARVDAQLADPTYDQDERDRIDLRR